MSMKQPVTRENLVIAAHALFDAQIGEPQAFMERPVGDEANPESECFERIQYQTFRYVADTAEAAFGNLWADLKKLWLISPWNARLYWRYPERVKIAKRVEYDSMSGPPSHVEYIVRTRMAFPDTPGALAFGTPEGRLDINEALLHKPWEWR